MTSSTSSEAQLKKRLRILMDRPENQKCCDCEDKKPTWASLIVAPPDSNTDIKMGAFCCFHCSGAHRRLGVHVCFVRSLTLDEWKEKEVKAVERGGNKRVNTAFEAKIGSFRCIKPNKDADLDARDNFIRAKYNDRSFFDPTKYIPGPDAPSEEERRKQLGYNENSKPARQQRPRLQRQSSMPSSHSVSSNNNNNEDVFADTSQLDLFSNSKRNLFASSQNSSFKSFESRHDLLQGSKMDLFVNENNIGLLNSWSNLFGDPSTEEEFAKEFATGTNSNSRKPLSTTSPRPERGEEYSETTMPLKSADESESSSSSASPNTKNKTRARSSKSPDTAGRRRNSKDTSPGSAGARRRRPFSFRSLMKKTGESQQPLKGAEEEAGKQNRRKSRKSQSPTPPSVRRRSRRSRSKAHSPSDEERPRRSGTVGDEESTPSYHSKKSLKSSRGSPRSMSVDNDRSSGAGLRRSQSLKNMNSNRGERHRSSTKSPDDLGRGSRHEPSGAGLRKSQSLRNMNLNRGGRHRTSTKSPDDLGRGSGNELTRLRSATQSADPLDRRSGHGPSGSKPDPLDRRSGHGPSRSKASRSSKSPGPFSLDSRSEHVPSGGNRRNSVMMKQAPSRALGTPNNGRSSNPRSRRPGSTRQPRDPNSLDTKSEHVLRLPCRPSSSNTLDKMSPLDAKSEHIPRSGMFRRPKSCHNELSRNARSPRLRRMVRPKSCHNELWPSSSNALDKMPPLDAKSEHIPRSGMVRPKSFHNELSKNARSPRLRRSSDSNSLDTKSEHVPPNQTFPSRKSKLTTSGGGSKTTPSSSKRTEMKSRQSVGNYMVESMKWSEYHKPANLPGAPFGDDETTNTEVTASSEGSSIETKSDVLEPERPRHCVA